MGNEKREYYDCSKILKEGSVYNIVIGQRSNGKTYGFIEEALGEYCENGYSSVYIRRYDESITGANIFKLCTPHIPSLVIMSNGKWNNFEYKNRCFCPIRVNDENGKIDYEALAEVTKFALKQGVDGIYACGGTAEFCLLTTEERKHCLEVIIANANGKEVIAHVGAQSTAEAIELAKHAEKEANPLYPVPKLMTAKELEKFYYLVM